MHIPLLTKHSMYINVDTRMMPLPMTLKSRRLLLALGINKTSMLRTKK